MKVFNYSELHFSEGDFFQNPYFSWDSDFTHFFEDKIEYKFWDYISTKGDHLYIT